VSPWGEHMTKYESSFAGELIAKVLFSLIAFSIINYYASYRFDLESFFSDFPGFSNIYNLMQGAIFWLYPLIFVAVGLAIKYFLKINKFEKILVLEEKIVVLLGQIVVSLCFFYIAWYIMFNIPGYPSPVDQGQIMNAFFWYCVTAFFTLGILSSDEFKYLINHIIRICLNRLLKQHAMKQATGDSSH